MMQVLSDNPNQSPSSKTFRARNGFSLVVTVIILILLSLIAVGLLGLSSTVLRSSQNDADVMEARANARLALQLAIGELQKTMGPDTRISANGSLLEGQRQVHPSKGQIAGAWNAWKIDPRNVGSYQTRKDGRPENDETDAGMPLPRGGFYRWLTSSRDPQSAAEINFISRAPDAGKTVLVAPLDNDDLGVEAETVSLSDNGLQSGNLAWAVFDEGQKASLNAYADTSLLEQFTPTETLNVQSEPSWANVEEWSILTNLDEDTRPKLISQKTLDLAGVENVERSRHDLTPYSASVLSNVVDGGLKTDLSLLFANEELPPDYADRHLYSNSEEPIVGIPPRGSHPYRLPSPDPKWSLLHDFYRLPLDVYNPDNPRVPFNATATRGGRPPTLPMRLTGMRTNPLYHEQIKLAPVISKAQFIFSLTIAQGQNLRTAWMPQNSPQGRTGSRWKSQLLMIIDPIITLWNPYDVPLDVEKFRIFLYRMPISFKFSSSNPNFYNPTNFTDFTLAVATGANQNTGYAYPLSILPEQGESSIVLQPGEHRVFSAHDYQTVWSIGRAEEEGRSVEMRPGWYPPGTQGPNARFIGGLSTENICKTSNQRASAAYKTDSGRRMSASTLLLEGNEKISISVKPSNSDTAAATFRTLGNQSSDFYLRYGAWVEDTAIRAFSEQERLSDFGAIELNYGGQLENRFLFPEFKSGEDLPTFPIDVADFQTAPVDVDQSQRQGHPHAPSPRGTVLKKPFLMATLHLKDLVGTSYTSKFPAKAWIHNNPTALYASAGFGGDEADLSAQQYEFSYQPLQGSWNNGVPEIAGSRHLGFGGPAPDAENGRHYAPAVSLPRARLTSLAQLRHAPLNQTGKQPLQAQVAGNSYAHPILDAGEVLNEGRFYLDHSFLANQTLFDTSFFSTATDTENLRDFVTGREPLIENRFQSVHSGQEAELDELLDSSTSPHNNAASLLMLKGAFNVNSTSVDAWRVFLSGLNQTDIPVLDSLVENGLGVINNSGREPHSSRYQVPLEQTLGGVLDPFGEDEQFAWNGYRRLENGEIQVLAENIVEQVKARGPFQSLAEFINRRAEPSSELSLSGALQTAIDASDINEGAFRDEHLIASGNEAGSDTYEYNDAAAGNTLTGTPGYLMQGDLLQSMAPYLTVRSDTFKIRSYGNSLDKGGRVKAEAWCEAIVQRTPEYLDSSDRPHEYVDEIGLSQLTETNKKFGRRFQIISFRWLTDPSKSSSEA
jgi:type II secretory pathway pseudopilin PulG